MSTKLYLNITNGPSISSLVDAFKYAYDKQTPHQATFTTRESDPNNINDGSKEKQTDISLKVTIKALEHEDGSGISVMFKGTMGILPYDSRYSTLYQVSGYYNTKRQKGYMIAES